ncbi:MAG: hypothetical protein V2I56_19675 [Desulfobacteraceae bacterium]|nr:hypothetical protein [Desulfobacteraceae bacterium]
MKPAPDEIVIVKLIKQAVEAEGCELSQVDFENSILKVEGPDEVIPACARAVADIIE